MKSKFKKASIVTKSLMILIVFFTLAFAFGEWSNRSVIKGYYDLNEINNDNFTTLNKISNFVNVFTGTTVTEDNLDPVNYWLISTFIAALLGLILVEIALLVISDKV